MLTRHIEVVVVQLLLGRVIVFGLKYLLVENISVFLPEAVALQNSAGAQRLMSGCVQAARSPGLCTVGWAL